MTLSPDVFFFALWDIRVAQVGTLCFIEIIGVYSMTSRKRKTNNGIDDVSVLMQAITDIEIGHKTIRATARSYSIPKSSLHRYIGKLHDKVPDIANIADEDLLNILRDIASYARPSLVVHICKYFLNHDY